MGYINKSFLSFLNLESSWSVHNLLYKKEKTLFRTQFVFDKKKKNTGLELQECKWNNLTELLI